MFGKLWPLGLAISLAAQAPAVQSKAESEAFPPAQVAADVLREAANADGAFIAAGMLKPSFSSDNLATMLLYPNDTIVVIALRGSQVRQAFERSISLYPQPNSSFLQVSGFEIVFDPKAAPGSRIRSVTVGDSPLDDNKTYNIAMPSSLSRGGYGYFKIWDRKIVSTVPDMTVEKALTGKRAVDSRPRWVAQS